MFIKSITMAIAISSLLGSTAIAGHTFTLFDAPGSTATFARAINKNNAITGWYEDSSGAGHGHLRASDGTLTTFDPPGSTYTAGSSINEKGTIAGSYMDTSGTWHGFARAPDGQIATFDPSGSFY